MISSIVNGVAAKIVSNGSHLGNHERTPLLPVILIDCVASELGANSGLDIAFNCNFCVFGTAACNATLDID